MLQLELKDGAHYYLILKREFEEDAKILMK